MVDWKDLSNMLSEGTIAAPLQDPELLAEIVALHLTARDIIERYPWILAHPIVLAAGGMDLAYHDLPDNAVLTEKQKKGKRNYLKFQKTVTSKIYYFKTGSAAVRLAAKAIFIDVYLPTVAFAYIPDCIRDMFSKDRMKKIRAPHKLRLAVIAARGKEKILEMGRKYVNRFLDEDIARDKDARDINEIYVPAVIHKKVTTIKRFFRIVLDQRLAHRGGGVYYLNRFIQNNTNDNQQDREEAQELHFRPLVRHEEEGGDMNPPQDNESDSNQHDNHQEEDQDDGVPYDEYEESDGDDFTNNNNNDNNNKNDDYDVPQLREEGDDDGDDDDHGGGGGGGGGGGTGIQHREEEEEENNDDEVEEVVVEVVVEEDYDADDEFYAHDEYDADDDPCLFCYKNEYGAEENGPFTISEMRDFFLFEQVVNSSTLVRIVGGNPKWQYFDDVPEFDTFYYLDNRDKRMPILGWTELIRPLPVTNARLPFKCLHNAITSSRTRLLNSIGTVNGDDNATGGHITLSELFVPLQLTGIGNIGNNVNNGGTNLQAEEASNGIAASMSNNDNNDIEEYEDDEENKDDNTENESKNDKKNQPHPTPSSPTTKEEYYDEQRTTADSRKREWDELKEDRDELKEENKKLKVDLTVHAQEKEKEINVAKQENKSLQSESDQKSTTITSLEQQLHTSKSNGTVHVREKEAMETEMNVAKQENKSLQSKSDQMSTTITSLQQQLQTSKSNGTVHVQEKEAMETEINVAKQENKSLQSESDQQLQQKTSESDQNSTTISSLQQQSHQQPSVSKQLTINNIGCNIM